MNEIERRELEKIVSSPIMPPPAAFNPNFKDRVAQVVSECMVGKPFTDVNKKEGEILEILRKEYGDSTLFHLGTITRGVVTFSSLVQGRAFEGHVELAG